MKRTWQKQLGAIWLIVSMVSILFTACKAPAALYHPAPPRQIILRSIDELNELRRILEIEDKKTKEDSLLIFNIESEKEAQSFLDVLESLPVIKLPDGTITLIMIESGTVTGKDSNGNLYDTGEYSGWFHITATAKDGSWMRVSYWLGDPAVAEKTVNPSTTTRKDLYTQPYVTTNKRIIIYSETREAKPEQNGNVISYLAKIDDVYAEIDYFTTGSLKSGTESIFNKVQIATVS